jgi:hypothetical protein
VFFEDFMFMSLFWILRCAWLCRHMLIKAVNYGLYGVDRFFGAFEDYSRAYEAPYVSTASLMRQGDHVCACCCGERIKISFKKQGDCTPTSFLRLLPHHSAVCCIRNSKMFPFNQDSGFKLSCSASKLGCRIFSLLSAF